MKNKWKLMFIVLASINFVLITVLLVSIISPEETKPIENKDSLMEGIPFTIMTNKHDLNRLVNQYLKDQEKGPIKYKIILEEDVNFYGTLPVFNQNIELKMSFDAVAQENGALLLKKRTLSLGDLKLPAAYVLKLISELYEFPGWVSIEPNEKLVRVNLQNMELKSGFNVRMDEFNLKEDRIIFTLFMPFGKSVSN